MPRFFFARLVACGLALLVLALPRLGSAQVALSGASAANLVRNIASLNPGESVQVTTTGCTGSTDTVLYLLEMTASPNRFVTRGYNDDYASTLCSSISYTNTSGAAKHFVIVAVAYSSTSSGTATLSITSPSAVFSQAVLVGGARNYDSPWIAGDSFNSKPWLGGTAAGGIDDVVLFAINTVPGSESYYDDDSGIAAHSQLSTLTGCAGLYACHVVAGGFMVSTPGGVTIHRDQKPRGGHDADGDGLADELEAPYGLSSSNPDSDGDGLLDYWEMYGVRSTGTGMEPSLVLPYRGAVPHERDIFLEVDYMDQPTVVNGVPAHTHQPDSTLNDVMNDIFWWERWWTGTGIHLHVEISQAITHYEGLVFGNCTGATNRLGFNTIKGNAAYFDPLRTSVYHYAIAGHGQAEPGSAPCPLIGSAGFAEQGGNDFIVTLGDRELPGAPGAGNVSARRLGVYVHELGHNLGLGHNGNQSSDSTGDANSCAHSSVMNYRFDQVGWGDSSWIPSSRRFSYSRGVCDNSNWDEGGECGNSCNAAGCVLYGEVSPKRACLLFTSNGLSDGVCDCDINEWGALDLTFQDTLPGQHASDGASLPDPSIPQPVRPVIRPATARARALGERKRAAMLASGLRQGVDFVFDPESAKIYVH